MISREIQELIRKMASANPTWGAPRIHGELLMLGIQLSESTVSKYLPRGRKPPSQGWRTFLTNHLHEAIAVDFAVVPTVTFDVGRACCFEACFVGTANVRRASPWRSTVNRSAPASSTRPRRVSRLSP